MSRRIALLSGILALPLLIGLTAPRGRETKSVTPGSPVESDLEPGATDAYSVSLRTGQFVHVAVEQNHLDAAVRIVSADGAELAEADNASDEDDPITLSAV